MVFLPNGGETTMCYVETSSLPLMWGRKEGSELLYPLQCYICCHSKEGPRGGEVEERGVLTGLRIDRQTRGRPELREAEDPTWPGCVPCWAHAGRRSELSRHCSAQDSGCTPPRSPLLGHQRQGVGTLGLSRDSHWSASPTGPNLRSARFRRLIYMQTTCKFSTSLASSIGK